MTLPRRIFLGAALFLLAGSAWMQIRMGNASDKNWLLAAANAWLSGKRLYTDIFEVNPPLIIWLYAVPCRISRALGFISDARMLGISGLALSAVSVGLCMRLVRLHPAFINDACRRTDFCLLLAFICAVFTAPMYFFDRDHILLVLTLPYMLRFAPGIRPQKFPLLLRIAVGLLAAVGFCIKPHALVVFAGVQLLYVARERSSAILWSVENLIIYVLAAAYLSAIVWVMPEYVHTVLPMALATYSAYSHRVNGVYSIIIFAIILGLAFSDFRPRCRSPYRAGVYYFLGVCGAYLAYGLLNNGWAYTYIPLLSMARLLSGWVLFEFLWLKKEAEAGGKPSQPFRFGIYSCTFNLAANTGFYVLCFTAYLLPTDCTKSLSCQSTDLFFKEARAQHIQSFGTMSLEFYKWPELVRETGQRWQTRFNHLWMLPKFMQSGPDFQEKHLWILNYVAQAYADDLNHNKPDAVYVDHSPYLQEMSPRALPAYFSGNSAFKDAWSHYRKTGVIDSCLMPPRHAEASVKPVLSDCRFDIYTRMPGL